MTTNSKGLALGHQKQAENGQATGHTKLRLQEEATSYLYDGLGLNVLKEYKGTSAPKAEYYFANGQVLARKMFDLGETLMIDREPGMANGGTYYYLTDALGSVTALTDHKGQVAREYRYDAFGGLFTGTLGVYNTTGLTGKSYDAKAGLMDYSARWYDPSAGRFTQMDPFFGWLDWPASLHKYTYVHNNPVKYMDPMGMSVCDPVVVLWDTPDTKAWTQACTHRVVDGRYYEHGGSSDPGDSGYWEYGRYLRVVMGYAWAVEYDGSIFENSLELSSEVVGDFYDWVPGPPPGNGGGGTPPPGNGGGGGDDGGGGEDPREPDIRYDYGPWTETERDPVVDHHEIPMSQRVVTTTTTIHERQKITELVDEVPGHEWYEHRSRVEAFAQEFFWDAGKWILSGVSGKPSAMSTEQKQQYQAAQDSRTKYDSTGVRPPSTPLEDWDTLEWLGGSGGSPVPHINTNRHPDATCNHTLTICMPIPGGALPPMDVSDHFGSPPGYPYSHHPGIDHMVPQNTPVLAVMDGIVQLTKTDCEPTVRRDGEKPLDVPNGWCGTDLYGRLGNTVALQHEDGTRTVYGHLKEVHVEIGQAVVAGEQVGTVGITGNTFGPHLHWELRVQNEDGYWRARNPLPLIEWWVAE